MYFAKKKKDGDCGEKGGRGLPESADTYVSSKETVLIVDDSELNREILVSILRTEKMEIIPMFAIRKNNIQWYHQTHILTLL